MAGGETLPETILIVDDEPDVRESTQALLESMGYRAVPVEDPSAVIETAQRESAAVILQDLRMPGLNVAGLVAALRSHPPTAEIPIIFFSASEEVPRTAARLDAWGYLRKPFSPEELGTLLRNALHPAPEGPGSREKTIHDVRHLFHDQWNMLSALANYTHSLQHSRDLSGPDQETTTRIADTLLKLEAKTDHLRAYVIGVVSAATPPPSPEAAALQNDPPRRPGRAHRRPTAPVKEPKYPR